MERETSRSLGWKILKYASSEYGLRSKVSMGDTTRQKNTSGTRGNVRDGLMMSMGAATIKSLCANFCTAVAASLCVL